MESQEFITDPQQLRAEAEKEPQRQQRGLDAYSETIRLLKEEKGFTFREIATWFHERSLKVDHNAVWRAYSKVARLVSGRASVEQSEQSEQRDAKEEAMPWLQES